MLRPVLLAALSFCLGLNAQDARSFQELSQGTPGCPRVDSASAGAHRQPGARPLKESISNEFVAKGARKPATEFGITNPDGTLQTLGSLKGQIVVVGFWSTKCNPSLLMLQEFRNFQKQTAERKMNLVFWPVHFETWPEALGFLRTKKAQLEGVEVKRLGIGEHGLSQLVDVLEVLPTVFIIDKAGGIATSWTGYQEGALLKRVNQMLAER